MARLLPQLRERFSQEILAQVMRRWRHNRGSLNDFELRLTSLRRLQVFVALPAVVVLTDRTWTGPHIGEGYPSALGEGGDELDAGQHRLELRRGRDRTHRG